MKLKRLLSLAVLCIVGMTSAWAEDIQELKALGWTQVTSIENVDQNYYVLVDAQTGLYSVGRGLAQGDRPMYHNLGNPTSDKNQVWILEGSGTSYKMKNLNDSYYFNSGDAGWNDYMDASNGTNFTFTLNNGKYDITASTGSVGPWNNDNKVTLGDGAENVAVNKAANQAPGFYLFAMSRTQYDASRFTASSLEAQGWQKATNIANIAGDSYYVIFLEAKGGSLAMAKTKSGRPAYKSLTNPLSNKAILWQLEASGTNYALKSVASGNYFQAEDWNTGFGNTKNYRTFVSLGEGKYALKNSSNNDYVGRWQNQEAAPYELENIAANKNEAQRGNYFVYYMSVSDYNTKRADAITAATEGASVETPKDLTGYIYNPRFSDLDRNGWTEGGTSGNRQFSSNAAECWNNNNMTFSQTFTNMPAGKYTLSLQAVNPSNGSTTGAKAFIGSEEKDITATHSSGNYADVCAALMNDASLGAISLDAVLQEDGDLTFGMKATTGWVIFDNFSLTYKGEVASAELGEVELSRTDGQYVNSSKFVVNYPNALSPNVGDELAFVSNAKVTVNGTEVAPVKEGNGFYFEIPNYAANSDYSVSIPADIFGFNSVKNEAISLTLHTPVILDQTAYIYSPLRNKFLSRGMDSGTSAILDNYGIPVNIRTNAEGKTTVQFVDNERYLFGANWAWTDGLDANITYYTVEPFTSTTTGHVGYKFISNAGKTGATLYINHGTIDRLANNSADGTNLYNDDYCVFQLKTKDERNAIKESIMLTQLVDVANKAGETISDEAGFNTLLATLTSNVDLTSYVKDAALAGTVDAWNPTNIRTWENNGPKYASNDNGTEFYQSAEMFSQIVSNLPKGIYKVTLSGYFRESSNANCVTWAEYDMSTAFIEANGYQVNLKTWASDRSANDAPNGMGAAKSLFDADMYKNELYTYVGEDGKLTLTISNPNCLPNGWMMIKDLKLTFYTTKSENVADGVHYYYGAWDDESVELTNNVPVLDVTGATGSFNVTATNANGLVYTNGATINDITNNVVSNGTCATLVLTDGGTFKAHKNFEATSVSYNMTAIAGDKFGTLMLPFAVSTIPNSCKAYTLDQGVNFGEEIHATEANAIAANKPVLVTKAGTYSANGVAVAATNDTNTNGELVGTYKAMTAEEGTYVLQKHDSGVAFYIVGETKPTVNPFRAYIKAQNAGVKSLNVVFDGEETAIDGIAADGENAGAIYDLSGRRVQKAQKGIYIVNGKKVVLK